MNASPRNFWIETLLKVVNPVFDALAEGRLREEMPVERRDSDTPDRASVAHLEAVGRCLQGVAPWFACEEVGKEEGTLRDQLFGKVLRGLENGLDPESPDCLNFHFPDNPDQRQPLVDAAFLAHGLLRSKGKIWEALNEPTRQRLVAGMLATRHLVAGQCNWLLFSSTVELFLREVGENWDRMRLDAAVRAHDNWFLGDGWYGDGESFATNYYNSFVMHPMLLEAEPVMRDDPFLAGKGQRTRELCDQILPRAQRYAEHLVRMIAPDGSFPPLGRSITYRCGAFQLLAQLALQEQLPEAIQPAAARTGLTRVIRRTLTAPGTFDDHSWLRLGLCGHQPELAENYITTGSLYLCTAAFLPLGLPETAPFWSQPHAPTPWEIHWDRAPDQGGG
ncbi:MAG: DUF2264 domain-containing protein [Puniceicoccaceae bacterium]